MSQFMGFAQMCPILIVLSELIILPRLKDLAAMASQLERYWMALQWLSF